MHFSEYEQVAGELQAALFEVQATGGELDAPEHETQLARVEQVYRNYEREFQNCVEAIGVDDEHRLQVLQREREDFTEQAAAAGMSVTTTELIQPVETQIKDRFQREAERVRLLMRERQMVLEHQIQKERFELEMKQRMDKLNLEAERAMLEVESAEERMSERLVLHSSVMRETDEANKIGESVVQANSKSIQVVSSESAALPPFSVHERVKSPSNSHVVCDSPSVTPSDARCTNNNHVVPTSPNATPPDALSVNNNHVVPMSPNGMSSYSSNTNKGHMVAFPQHGTSVRASDVNSGHVSFVSTHGISPQVQNVNTSHVVVTSPTETPSYVPGVMTSPTETPSQTANVNNNNNMGTDQGYPFDTADLVNALQAPPAQLQSFDGSPLKFHSFMLDFEANVERRLRDPAARMSRLRQQCIGRAATVIQSCASLPPSEGYKTARELLRQRFGTPLLIAQATIENVMKQERVRKDDARGLQQLADQLRVSYITLNAVNGLAEINSQQGLMTIVQKLPEYLQHKWRSQAVRINSDEGRLCTFLDLTTFIERAALESNIPVFGVKPMERPASRYDGTGKKQHGSRLTVNNVTSSKKTPTCVLCKGEHWISRCEKFRKKTPEERNNIAKDKRLCFNCLSDSHMLRQCKSTLKCRECNRSHHTLIHRQRAESDKRENEQASTLSNEAQSAKREVTGCVMQGTSQRVSLPVCAIKVRPVNGGEEISTFCLLDQGSSCSFVSQQLVRKLGMKPKKSTVTISTVNCTEEGRETEVVSLIVSDVYGNTEHAVSRAYTLPTLPVESDDFPRREDLSCYPHLAGIDLPDVDLDEVTVLLGQTDADCLIPLDVVQGRKGEPYATRTKLGWTINGPMKVKAEGKHKVKNFHAKIRDCCEALNEEVKEFWKLESHGLYEDTRMLSEVDKKVMREWEETTTFDSQNFSMIIPFKSENPQLPNSKPMAVTRVHYLEKKLKKDKKLCEQYTERMENMISKGYAELVPQEELNKDDGKVFYVPHHGVVSPNKDKIRVVFDCAAKYKGQSLNQFIHAGPDQTQKLIGVLLRFRMGRIAVMADIQEMYYQVKVQPQDRDVLRFLWFTGGRLNGEPDVYRMTRHLFGGTWSPSCCLTALQYAVEKFGQMNGEEQEAVIRSFYVDDYLRSSDTTSQALQHAVRLKSVLAQAGFNITKWLSNDLDAVSDIPGNQQSAKSQDLALGGQVKERALGVIWHVDSDNLGYNVCDKSKPATKRGVLSTLSSVYDPLGLVSPFILQARLIMQELCRQKIDWDEQVPELQAQQWDIWKKELKKLAEFKVSRWVRTRASTSSCQLHHFCDASMVAYGVVSYIVMKGEEGRIQSEIVMAKSRLAPIKVVSIPRLELLACTLAARQDRMLTKELSNQVKLRPAQFWTDSKIVLGYINNTEKRFHTFVANRVEVIKDHTQSHQWHHVESAQNPADDASRGVSPEQLMTSRWLHGPQFVMENASMVWSETESYDLVPEDPEVKSKERCLAVVTTKSPTEKFIEYHSSWENLLIATAWILAIKDRLVKNGEMVSNINSERLLNAELSIIKYVQGVVFKEEIEDIKRHGKVKRQSSLIKLNPIVCDGIMLLGGRLARAPVSESVRYPVILPSDHHITELIVYWIHWKCAHAGREYVLAQCREKYWIINGRSVVRRIVSRCVLCRKRDATVCQQQMAPLPVDRVTPGGHPFQHTGVDLFGPFSVTRGRGTAVRYACLFTCLTSRAIHVEVVHSLDADSFVLALQRFTSRRGCVKVMRSDNGRNFVRAEKEMRENLQRWSENTRVMQHLRTEGVDWRFNPPYASAHGGVWERQIRTVRKVLAGLCREQTMTEESLPTFMCVAENIVNNRPITTVSMDPSDLEPLTPNHLLLHQADNMPPGVFGGEEELYARKRYKQVNYLADLFWRRWIKEYLPELHRRTKWQIKSRGLHEGDVVLVVDTSLPRNQWNLGRVLKGSEGDRRSARIRTKTGDIVRPLAKLCLLEPVGAPETDSKEKDKKAEQMD